MKSTEIIAKYTAGEATLEETNAKLKEFRSGFHLDPERNVIKPGEVGRFGLLDTGTTTFDKVEVKDGKVFGFNAGDSYALLLFNGKTYRVQGDTLVE